MEVIEHIKPAEGEPTTLKVLRTLYERNGKYGLSMQIVEQSVVSDEGEWITFVTSPLKVISSSRTALYGNYVFLKGSESDMLSNEFRIEFKSRKVRDVYAAKHRESLIAAANAMKSMLSKSAQNETKIGRAHV